MSEMVDTWPRGGTPLVEGIQSEYFLPVTEEILSKITQRIVTALKPERVILFGSYAHGTPHVESDVDLLVIMETKLPPAQRALAICRLIRPRPFPVDILVKTPEEIENALATNDSFIKEILKQGRVLYVQP